MKTLGPSRPSEPYARTRDFYEAQGFVPLEERTAIANDAFLSAMNDGFVISAVVLLSSVVIAFTLIPTRMRDTQAEFQIGKIVAAIHRVLAVDHLENAGGQVGDERL